MDCSDLLLLLALVFVLGATWLTVVAILEDGKWYRSGDFYNCSDFDTCEQLMLYWVTCWPYDPSELDRDKDGVPCESICGHYDQETGIWERP